MRLHAQMLSIDFTTPGVLCTAAYGSLWSETRIKTDRQNVDTVGRTQRNEDTACSRQVTAQHDKQAISWLRAVHMQASRVCTRIGRAPEALTQFHTIMADNEPACLPACLPRLLSLVYRERCTYCVSVCVQVPSGQKDTV